MKRLREFYENAFGWQLYEVAPDYSVVETYPHEHDESGNDVNPSVVLDVQHGTLVWKYAGDEGNGHVFIPGIPEGGLGAGEPGVIVYIEVEDVQESLTRVESLGGTVLQTPFEIPGYTTVARFADPEGNSIGLQRRR
jgi:predicted enzyme related to lactoylglutathione lyase